MSSGKVVQIYRTRCYQDDVVNPEWNETFEFDFDDFGPDNDQPIMLIFDILGSAGKHIVHYDAIWEACDHLGTAMIPVSAIKDERAFAKGEARHRVPLLGECQLIEKRLDREGNIVSEEKALEEEEDEKEEKTSRKVKKRILAGNVRQSKEHGHAADFLFRIEEGKRVFSSHYRAFCL